MKKITLFEGDGIGPEITQTVLDVFKALEVPIEFEKYDIGQTSYDKTGILIPEDAIESIKRNKLALKAPITTPIGKGFRSINVELRMIFDLYANIRPVKTYKQLKSRYENVDIIVYRENTEDLYIGEEKQVSEDECIAIKRITRHATRRIIKKAFNDAVKLGRKKVTCVHKANILKLTDGMFLDEFNKIKKEYPSIEADDLIVDIACMKLVMQPENFDLMVMPNLYGDIISDLTSGLTGGVGLSPSVNMNDECAMFEAVHGSAPKHAGLNDANPTAFLLSACMMLDHIGYQEEGDRVRAAINSCFDNIELC
ncbi:MAG TPA: isocitrate/isopropylmalate dehydrogenase family protein, partial [Thermoclostridium sp.]|nr:isocitrate/isopropylmalate dehydrogenase family protein [Thermoclostridium sp.]